MTGLLCIHVFGCIRLHFELFSPEQQQQQMLRGIEALRVKSEEKLLIEEHSHSVRSRRELKCVHIFPSNNTCTRHDVHHHHHHLY